MMTDTEISRFDGRAVKDKELIPWEGPTGEDLDRCTLDDHGGGGTQNGWDAEDMFRLNAEKYDVKTSFREDLDGYT